MRRASGAACLATALIVSACGTTVPLTSAGTGSGGGGNLGAVQDASGNVGALPTPTTVQSATGVQTATAGGAIGPAGGPAVHTFSGGTGGYGTASGGRGGPSKTVAVTAPGLTADTITVGIPVATDTSAVASSFGIKGGGSVPPQDMINAVTADVNKSGGILGRKLATYIHGYSAASWVSNPSEVDAEICTDFREDHRVFAVMYDLVDSYIRDCTAAMGSPLIAIGTGDLFPLSAYTAHGGNFLYAPDVPTTEQLAHLFVQSLMARNFQQSWNITAGGPGAFPTKFGVIHPDTPDSDTYYADIENELSKYGFKFVDTATYSDNVQAGFAATQSAVLKFRSDGISHVFGASAFFLDAAESQKYFPRYAYLPGLGQLGAQNSPAAQMNGALTVGWSPVVDVAAEQDPGDTPGAKHCRAVMAAAGLPTSNRSDVATMYIVCDAIYSFRSALNAGGVPSVAGLRAGFESLGSSFPPALTFTAFLDKTHHYGVDSVRDMAYNESCTCLEYTSRENRS